MDRRKLKKDESVLFETALHEDGSIFGYYMDDMEKKMHAGPFNAFFEWMDGQTMGLTDDGRRVVYLGDYQRWLAGLPVID